MIVVADEASDVGVNARDGLAKELVSEVPDVAVPLRAAKRLGMQGRGGDGENVLADLLDKVLPALIVPQRLAITRDRVQNCLETPPAHALGASELFRDLSPPDL